MDNKVESANLILKLYELRREEVMRQARRWFISSCPETLPELQKALIDPQLSAYFRMVTTYWDMACSFVVNGAIDEQMFNDANAEHIAVYCQVEPYLAEWREHNKAPHMLRHIERVVTNLPDAPARLAATRERLRARRAAAIATSTTGEGRASS